MGSLIFGYIFLTILIIIALFYICCVYIKRKNKKSELPDRKVAMGDFYEIEKPYVIDDVYYDDRPDVSKKELSKSINSISNVLQFLKDSIDSTPSAEDIRNIKRDLKIIKDYLEEKSELSQKDLDEIVSLRTNIDAVKNYLLHGEPSTTSLRHSINSLRNSIGQQSEGVKEQLQKIQSRLRHITHSLSTISDCRDRSCPTNEESMLMNISKTLSGISENLKESPLDSDSMQGITQTIKDIVDALMNMQHYSPENSGYSQLLQSILMNLNVMLNELKSIPAPCRSCQMGVCPMSCSKRETFVENFCPPMHDFIPPLPTVIPAPPQAPKCNSVMINGQIIPSATPGTMVNIDCGPGAKFMDGNSTKMLTCTASPDNSSSSWMPDPNSLSCKSSMCGAINFNGQKIPPTEEGGTATLMCGNGVPFSNGEPTKTIACTPGRNGEKPKWSPSPGSLSCFGPCPAITFDGVDVPSVEVGGSYTINCGDGMKFNDGTTTKTLTCEPGQNGSGVWQPDPGSLKCISSRCGTVNFMGQKIPSSDVGASTTVSCGQGMQFGNGSASKGLTCTQPDPSALPVWQPDPGSFNCITNECPDLNYGDRRIDGGPIGTVAKLSCKDGMRFADGPIYKNVTCSENPNGGTPIWKPDPANFDCVTNLCPATMFGGKEIPSKPVGTKYTVTCPAGDAFTDGTTKQTLTCKRQANGSPPIWEPSPAQLDCVSRECEPSSFKGTDLPRSPIGARVAINCGDDQAFLDGSINKNVLCKSRGKNLPPVWNPDPDTISCRPNTCPATAFAGKNVPESPVGKSVDLSCGNNKQFTDGDPEKSIICKKSDDPAQRPTWSPDPDNFSCMTALCPNETFAGKAVQGGPVGTKRSISCSPNQQFSNGQGSKNVTCIQGEPGNPPRWQPDPGSFTCVPKPAPPPPKPPPAPTGPPSCCGPVYPDNECDIHNCRVRGEMHRNVEACLRDWPSWGPNPKERLRKLMKNAGIHGIWTAYYSGAPGIGAGPAPPKTTLNYLFQLFLDRHPSNEELINFRDNILTVGGVKTNKYGKRYYAGLYNVIDTLLDSEEYANKWGVGYPGSVPSCLYPPNNPGIKTHDLAW